MENVEISEYTKSDRESCLILLEKAFTGISDERNFAWRFESLDRPHPLIVCAKHSGKVVAMHSWVPWEFCHNEKKYLGYQGGEAATDEQFQGQGLQGKLIEFGLKLASDRDFDFIISLGGTFKTYASYVKTGHYPILNLPHYTRILNPFNKKLLDKEPFISGETLPHRVVEKNKLTPVVDNSYIQWRYFNNPKKYEILKYKHENNSAIFFTRIRNVYFKGHKTKFNDLLLLDCQFSTLNEEFIKSAFDYLTNIYARKAFYITTFLNENTERGKEISKNFHFKSGKRYKPFLIKPINRDLDLNIFNNCHNWDLLPHIVDWW
jgi:hypothetical protein